MSKEEGKKVLESLKIKDKREEYEHARKLDAFDHQRELAKEKLKEMEALLDPEINTDAATVKGEPSGEWKEIRKYIMIHFPEAKQHANMSAHKICVGVAYALGWDVTKIAKESKLNRSTIYDWIKTAEVENLINEFRIKEGKQDPQALMTSTGYKALKLLDHILSIPVDHRNRDLTKIQQDTAKFQVQQAFGKATETINVNEVSYKDVAEQIHKKKRNEEVEELSQEEEEELFNS